MICIIEECKNSAIARGWCQRHYDSWRYHGDPEAAKRGPPGEAVAWIKRHINFSDPSCLIWPFYRRTDGHAATVWPQGANGPQVLATRYMCELAKGPAPTSVHEAAHKCGNGHLGCIHPKHLRWATRQENVDDKDLHGTQPIGEKNPAAKLTETKVLEIRQSSATLDVLAAKYGVSRGTIWDARVGKTWSHVR
jgi:hypothetical protein